MKYIISQIPVIESVCELGEVISAEAIKGMYNVGVTLEALLVLKKLVRNQWIIKIARSYERLTLQYIRGLGADNRY